MKGAKISDNVTRSCTDERYAARFDNSVFAPTDPTGTILMTHSSAAGSLRDVRGAVLGPFGPSPLRGKWPDGDSWRVDGVVA